VFSGLQILLFVPIFLIRVRKCTYFSHHNSLCSEAKYFFQKYASKSTKAYQSLQAHSVQCSGGFHAGPRPH